MWTNAKTETNIFLVNPQSFTQTVENSFTFIVTVMRDFCFHIIESPHSNEKWKVFMNCVQILQKI